MGSNRRGLDACVVLANAMVLYQVATQFWNCMGSCIALRVDGNDMVWIMLALGCAILHFLENLFKEAP